MLKTTDLNVEFLGINPVLSDKTGTLTPEQISAFSALLTFKGKTVRQLLNQTIEKGQDVKKKVHTILQKSSLLGHASINTLPVFSFTFSGSKMIDSMLTGITFSSSLMASGRRTDTTHDDIVYPTSILKNIQARKLFETTMKSLIDSYQVFLESGIKKDIASRLLPYGIFGTGIISLPVESLVAFKREWELEKDWMPEEAKLLLATIEQKLADMGIQDLYETRMAAPRNTYPYPNIFKDPNATNQINEVEKHIEKKETVLVRLDIKASRIFKKHIQNLIKETKKMAKSQPNVKKNWYGLQQKRGRLLRDFGNALSYQFLSRVSWRIWGEKKRHRTIPQVVESVYKAIESAWRIVSKHPPNKNLPSADLIKYIDLFISIPHEIRQNKKMLLDWYVALYQSLSAYQKLIKWGIKPSDALFVIPRGIRLKVLQEYNFFNLVAGYYPLRLCNTVEPQLRNITSQEIFILKKELEKQNMAWLNPLLVPKCYLTGFCPEASFCSLIKLQQKNYNEAFHKEMKEELEKRARSVFPCSSS